MVTVYGIRSCDTCRKAATWLEDHGIEYRFVDLRADGFGETELTRWQDQAGWEQLLNKRSLTWRKIPPVDREGLDAPRAAQLILEHPTVLRRPLLEFGDEVLLGFDATEYARRLDVD